MSTARTRTAAPPASRRRRLAAGLAALLVGVTGCGGGDDGPSGLGRACRNVERLLEAVSVGDSDVANDELDRLTDRDEIAERLDVGDLDDAVERDDVDDIEQAVDGLGCDLLDVDPDPTDPDPTDPDPTDPDPTDPDPTDPTTTDSTTDSSTDFTLPSPPTDPAPTDPTTATTTATTPEITSATVITNTSAPPSPPQNDPDSPALIPVDVDAREGGDTGPSDPRTARQVVDEFGVASMLVPEGPHVIREFSISRDFGEFDSSFDRITYSFASELGSPEVLKRFRRAIASTGDYSFTESQSETIVDFTASPRDFDDPLPSWSVDVPTVSADVMEVDITRSTYDVAVEPGLPAEVREPLGEQLGFVDELGWEVTGFRYSVSYDFQPEGFFSRTVDFDVPADDTPKDAARRLVPLLGSGAEVDDEDADSVIITVGESAGDYWIIGSYSDGVTGSVYTTD
ncbi:MAG: hypothetical protein M3Q72_03800 [Actinomycetota bacterium]|nr:hypothetical protein [Actinomycetota bacterium]